ncbi:MAG: hypothetical protein RLZ83_1617, partial [Pseudomonadota bacterium]
TLTVSTPGDNTLGLRWAADAVLLPAEGDDALTAGAGATLTLRGTAAELSRYLASGRLEVRATQASALGFELVSAATTDAAAVVSTGSIRVDYSAAGSLVDAAQALTLQWPQSLTVEGSGLVASTLTLPLPPVGAEADASLRLELSMAVGTLAADRFDGLAGATWVMEGRRLHLDGTAAQLNAWLAAGRLQYSGPGGALDLTLRQGDDAASAAQQLRATITLVPASPSVPAIALPQTMPVFAGVESVLAIGGQPVAGAGRLVLEAQVDAGTLQIAVGSTLDDTDTATDRVRVAGTAAELNAWLAAGALRHVGPGGTLSLSVRNESGLAREVAAHLTLQAVEVVETAGTQGLGLLLPASLAVGDGVPTLLTLTADTLAGDPQAEFSLDLEVGSGRLTVKPAGADDGAALAAVSDLDPLDDHVRVTGTIATLNAWLSAGRLVYEGAETVLTARLTTGDRSVQGRIVLAASGPIVAPSVSAPGVFHVVPGIASPLVWPSASLGAGDAPRTVTLSVAAGGAFSAEPDTGLGVGVAGSGTDTLTLTGTAAALGLYLSDAQGRVTYTGATVLDVTAGVAQTVRMTVADAAGRVARADLQLAGASAALFRAPELAALSSQLWVTPNTASQLTFGTVALTGSGTLSLELSLPSEANGLALTAGQGLSVTLPDGGGLSVEAAESRLLRLSGSAEALTALLAGEVGRVDYTGPATGAISLGLRLTDAVGSVARDTVTLAAPTPSTAQLSGATLTLPASRVGTPGALVPIVLSAQALQAAGEAPVVIEFEAPLERFVFAGLSGSTIELPEGVVTVGEGAPVDSAALSPASTRLQGAASALNALLGAYGRVWFDPSSDEALVVRVVDSVASRGQISIVTTPAAEQPFDAPSLVLPQRFDLPAGGLLVLPVDTIVGAGTIEATLSVSAGTLVWQADDSLSGVADGIALEAGEGQSLHLVGTAQALNAYLSRFGALRFGATGDVSAATLGVRVATVGADGAAAEARADAQIGLLALEAQASSLAIALPQTLVLAASGSSLLVFDEAVLVASGPVGAVTLRITPPAQAEGETVTTGEFTAVDLADDGVDVVVGSDGVLQLSGSAEAIGAYLATAGNLSYDGPSGQLALDASAAAPGVSAHVVVQMARPGGDGAQLRNAPRLTLPYHLAPGADGALNFGAQALLPAAFSGVGAVMDVAIDVAGGGLRIGRPLPTGITLGDGASPVTLGEDRLPLEAQASFASLRLSGPASRLAAWLAEDGALVFVAPSEPDPLLVFPEGAQAELSVSLTQDGLTAAGSTWIGVVSDGVSDTLPDNFTGEVVAGDLVLDEAWVAARIAQAGAGQPVQIAATGDVELSEAVLQLASIEV